MKTSTRRQWLKLAGATSATALISGWQSVEASPIASSSPFPSRPLATPIQLNANENPFGPSKRVREAMQKAFDHGNRYPFRYIKSLVNQLAEKEGVSADHIVITAGSTEGLKIAGLTYGLHGREIIAADPTFLSLMNYAQQFGATVHQVPVDDKLGHDLKAMERRITSNTGLVYICNPNNPTGTVIPAAKLRDFCDSVSRKTLVFCDEAYQDFIEIPGYPSMVELVKKGQNLIVARTFSKVYSLAGIRVGYLIARPDIASKLKKNVVTMTNVLAIAAAKEALNDKEFYNYSLQKNREAKQLIYNALDELKLEYSPSHTNFVFFKTGRQIQSVMQDMQKQGIIVGRPFPPLTDWCRISTGTLEETRMFTEALKAVF